MTIDELYTEYFDDIYRFVFSLTKNESLTEDIVQETFTRAYLNLNSFKKPPNKAWLFTVSRNLFYDHLRKNKKTSDMEIDLSTIPDNEISPEARIFEKENIQRLYEAIENLDEKYRNAIICFYVKELSYKSAAEQMKVTEANFKSILFRAKKKLKRCLKRKDDFFE